MKSEEWVQIGERSLKNAEYAGNAALLAEILMTVVALTNNLADEREEFGIKLNFSKILIIAATMQCEPLKEAVHVGSNNNIEVVKIDYVEDICHISYATKTVRRFYAFLT